MKNRPHLPWAGSALALAALFSLATSASGQSAYTWNGGSGSSGNWTDGGNWGGTAPGSPQGYLNFAGSTRLTNTNNFSTGSAGFQIYFKSGAGTFNLYGNSITFYDYSSNDPNIQNEGTGLQFVNFPIVIGNTHESPGILNFNVNGGTQGPMTINGTISAASSQVINLNGSGTLTFNGVIQNGSGSSMALTQLGSGTSILTATNTYTGQTTISGGTLQIGTNSTTGTLGTGNVVVNNGATLAFNLAGSSAVNNTISSTANFTIAQNGSGTVTLGGSADNSFAQATVNNGTLVLGKSSTSSVHALGGTTETVNSGGTLRLGGSGGDQIQDGASVVVNSGGTFDVAGLSETINAISLNGTGVAGAALTNSSSSAATLTVNNPCPIPGALTIGLNGNLTIAGSGAFSNTTATVVTKTGAGTLTLSAGAADNLNLLLTVSNGTVVLNKTSSSGVHAIGGLTVASGATVQLAGSGGYQIYQGANPVIASGGVLDLNGQSQTFTNNGPTVSGTGTGAGVLINSSAATPATLTGPVVLGAASTFGGAGNFAVSGAVSDGSSGYALTKAGAGTLTLQGANTYSGNTVINAGTLALGSAGSVSNSPNVILAAGATFDVSAQAAFNLSASTTLKASGTGAAPGSTAATINGGGTVNLNARPLVLNFAPTAFTGDTAHPALLVTNASLTLNNNSITLTNTAGTALGAGVYRIVQVGNGTSGTISGTPNATPATIAGAGIAAGTTASLSVASGDIILTVQTVTTNRLTLTSGSNPSTYGNSVTFSATISPAPANGESVTFKDGATTLGTGTTVSGVATFSTAALAYGSHSITAVYPGDTTDTASTSTALAFNVNKANVTIAAGIAALAKTYDGTTAAVISSNNVSLSGLVAGDAANVALSTNGYTASFAAKNVGNSVSVTVGGLALTGSAAGNYTLIQPAVSANITVKPLTAAGTLAAPNKPYDGTTGESLTGAAALLAAEAPGTGSSGDNQPYTGDAVSVTGTPTGTFASSSVNSGITVNVTGLSLTGAQATNYSLTAPVLTANITPAPLTITANDTNKVYGQSLTLSAGAYTVSGLTNSDTVGSVTLTCAGLTNSAGAGIYSITPGAASGTGLGNYSISYVNGTLTVGPALLGVTANNQSRAYGATNPVFTVSYTGFVNSDSLTNSDVVGLPVLVTAADTNSPTGSYVITNTLGTLASTNYTFALTNGTLTVAPAAITVTADNQVMVYGGTVPALTASYNGFLNGDTAAVISGSPTLSVGASSNSPAGAYVITNTLGTLSATNYAFTLVNGTLTVSPLGVTVTADSQTKLYGAADPALTYGYSPALVGGDTFTGALSRAAGNTVGSYAITQGTLALSTNYHLTFVGTNLTITPAAFTITANNASKTYGTTLTLAGTEFTTGPLVSGDSVASVTLTSTGATASAAPGAYDIVSSAATGTGLGNYTISYANGTLTVNAASSGLTVGSSSSPVGYLAGVAFSATVNTNATGSVIFSTAAGAFSTNALTSGTATSVTITNLPRGTNVLTVVYCGDANYLAATNTFNEVVTNHPPVAQTMIVTVTAGLGAEIALTDLATNWSDVDGDAVELAALNFTSTNGATVYPINLTTNLDGSFVISSNAFLGYTNPANVADQISYTISDGYGGSATGYINILVQSAVTGTNSITSVVSGNPTLLTAYGVPGYTYITQRSTNLFSGLWVNVATNTAATNGVINVSDAFTDLGGTAPSQAYYRLFWQP